MTRRYPPPTPFVPSRLSPHVTDRQASARIILDMTAAASQGDFEALAWIASTRLDLHCDLTRIPVENVRRITLARFLESRDPVGVEALVAEEAQLRAAYTGRSTREAAIALGISHTSAARALRRIGAVRRVGRPATARAA